MSIGKGMIQSESSSIPNLERLIFTAGDDPPCVRRAKNPSDARICVEYRSINKEANYSSILSP